MKTLQKATLAVAIAAAPFLATNALEALDDEFLSEMTGQAGVTIETTTGSAGTTVGHIYYTDTDGQAEGPNTGGSVAIVGTGGNPAISNTGGTYDAATETWTAGDVTTRQIIDVDSFGNLVIQKENVSGGSTKLEIGQVELRSKTQHTAGTAGAVLVQDLSIIKTEGDKGSTHIVNLSDVANNTNVAAAGARVYTNGTLITTADDAKLDKAIASGSTMAIVTKGSSKIERLDAKLLGGAIEIENLSYMDADDANGFMTSTQVIYAVGGVADPSDANNKSGVWIQGSASSGTLSVGAIKIGGSSIGQIDIGRINQAGNTTRIYGH